LFAVSHNRCAFPSCDTPLVDKQSGKVTGRICHIRGRSTNGPRYDPQQSEVDRHGFANLLLMCPVHHDVVDKDVDAYSVQRLTKIKAEHETGIADNPQASDEVAEQLINNSENVQVQWQSSGAHSVNYQAGRDLVLGSSLADIRTIAIGVFHENFPRLQAEAAREVERRFNTNLESIIGRIAHELSPELWAKVADPDVQFKLYEVLQAGVRRDERQLQEHLASLIIERIKNHGDAFKRIVLNEAITTVPKITRNQLNILALCSLVHSCDFSVISWSDFELEFCIPVSLLLGLTAADIDFRHLKYCGCVTDIKTWDADLHRLIQTRHLGLLQRRLSADEFAGVAIPDPFKAALFVGDTTQRDSYFLNVANMRHLEGKLSALMVNENMPREYATSAVNLLSSMTAIDPAAQKRLFGHATYLQLESIWGKGQFSTIELTPVGAALADIHLEKITSKKLPWL
jgi:hypothetical protein